MNIYDTANRLAQEIKESNEYKNYKELKNKIDSNPEKKQKLEEFGQLRYEIQIEAMQNVNNGNESNSQNNQKLVELQDKYMELLKDDEFKDYFDAEVKFNVMVTDVNKIIAEAVKDVL